MILVQHGGSSSALMSINRSVEEVEPSFVEVLGGISLGPCYRGRAGNDRHDAQGQTDTWRYGDDFVRLMPNKPVKRLTSYHVSDSTEFFYARSELSILLFVLAVHLGIRYRTARIVHIYQDGKQARLHPTLITRVFSRRFPPTIPGAVPRLHSFIPVNEPASSAGTEPQHRHHNLPPQHIKK